MLWENKYDCPLINGSKEEYDCKTDFKKCTPKNGHVAMILGIVRGINTDGSDTILYVGEAVGKCGNRLKHYSLAELVAGTADITWIEECSQKTKQEVRLIRMDRVYNYLKDPDEKDPNHSSKIPANVDLNTFKYTDMWWDEPTEPNTSNTEP